MIDFKNKIFVGANGRESLMDARLLADSKAVVIFMHGYKGYKDWGCWNQMQDKFVEAGYGFVKFNVSHNGGTVDDPIDFPDLEAFGQNRYSYENYDLGTVVQETERLIKQEMELDIPIYLLGHSRGGGMAVIYSSTDRRIRKLVSLAGICDIGLRFPVGDDLLQWENDGVMYVQNARTNQSMPHYYSFYEDYLDCADALDIEKAASSLDIPFLQIHGDMDTSVSISEGQRLAQWTGSELCVIKGAAHTFGTAQPWGSDNLPEEFEEMIDAAIEFFNK